MRREAYGFWNDGTTHGQQGVWIDGGRSFKTGCGRKGRGGAGLVRGRRTGQLHPGADAGGLWVTCVGNQKPAAAEMADQERKMKAVIQDENTVRGNLADDGFNF